MTLPKRRRWRLVPAGAVDPRQGARRPFPDMLSSRERTAMPKWSRRDLAGWYRRWAEVVNDEEERAKRLALADHVDRLAEAEEAGAEERGRR